MSESHDAPESINTNNTIESNNKVIESVVKLAQLPLIEVPTLLKKYKLSFRVLKQEQSIVGSFWGESEAGLINNTLYARMDTPIHSILHETCHYICMDEPRRENLNTNAGGNYDEENAVCYLQVLLADYLPSFSRDQMMKDMDIWGYTFRLGSTKAWFENDAEDALDWLKEKQLINNLNQPNYSLRIM